MPTSRMVIKRDGLKVSYDEEKIANSIRRAGRNVGIDTLLFDYDVAQVVSWCLNKNFNGKPRSTDDIQDAIEKVLIEVGHNKIAKSYIMGRREKETLIEKLKLSADLDYNPDGIDIIAKEEVRGCVKSYSLDCYVEVRKGGVLGMAPDPLFKAFVKEVDAYTPVGEFRESQAANPDAEEMVRNVVLLYLQNKFPGAAPLNYNIAEPKYTPGEEPLKGGRLTATVQIYFVAPVNGVK